MNKSELVSVAGAGGFIGGHLVASLRQQGYQRLGAVDIKPVEEWYLPLRRCRGSNFDLRDKSACDVACQDAKYVFNLAADMGGMGFIVSKKALCVLTVLINTHALLAAHECWVRRFFFSSLACVYAVENQTSVAVTPLAEADADPAMPEDGYGRAKLSARGYADISRRTSGYAGCLLSQRLRSV